MSQSQDTISIEQLLRVLRGRWWLVPQLMVAGAPLALDPRGTLRVHRHDLRERGALGAATPLLERISGLAGPCGWLHHPANLSVACPPQ